MTITINGQDFVGKNVSIINGRILIDGKPYNNARSSFWDFLFNRSARSGIVEINVTGSLVNLTTDANVNCQNVTGSVSAGGSIVSVDVGGNITAGGSVNCRDVAGNVEAGGSVSCGTILPSWSCSSKGNSNKYRRF